MTWSLSEKTCLVTGGTAGIGFVTARELACQGAFVVIVGRDARRGAAAAAAIGEVAGPDRVAFARADLSDQAQVRALAAEIHARHEKLDVLINNAGGLFGSRQISVDGIEMTLAVNHLAGFLSTHLLLPLLRKAPAGRIVVVASEAHRGAEIDFADLQGEIHYNRWTAYKRSKLANILFSYELARRLQGEPITVNSLHPGFVATDIGVRHGFVPQLLWRIGQVGAISPKKGAATSVYLAGDAEVAGRSGLYFIDCRPARSSAASYDRQAAERLWDISVNLTTSGSRA